MSRVEHLAEGITLYLGDCREILPTLFQVDHVICDPPYSSVVHDTRGRRGDELRKDGGPPLGKIGFDAVESIQATIATQVQDICSGWFVPFSDIFGLSGWREAVLHAGGKSKSVCIWIKPDCAPQFNGQKPATAFECIGVFWCGSGHSSWNGGGKRGLYTHNTNGPTRHGVHPTEKPISLMSDLVADFSKSGQTILDPFMGSGTTGVACVKLGRKFIGVEFEPKYFDISCKRISAALARPDLFIKQPVRIKQEALAL